MAFCAIFCFFFSISGFFAKMPPLLPSFFQPSASNLCDAHSPCPEQLFHLARAWINKKRLAILFLSFSFPPFLRTVLSLPPKHPLFSFFFDCGMGFSSQPVQCWAFSVPAIFETGVIIVVSLMLRIFFPLSLPFFCFCASVRDTTASTCPTFSFLPFRSPPL